MHALSYRASRTARAHKRKLPRVLLVRRHLSRHVARLETQRHAVVLQGPDQGGDSQRLSQTVRIPLVFLGVQHVHPYHSPSITERSAAARQGRDRRDCWVQALVRQNLIPMTTQPNPLLLLYSRSKGQTSLESLAGSAWTIFCTFPSLQLPSGTCEGPRQHQLYEPGPPKGDI